MTVSASVWVGAERSFVHTDTRPVKGVWHDASVRGAVSVGRAVRTPKGGHLGNRILFPALALMILGVNLDLEGWMEFPEAELGVAILSSGHRERGTGESLLRKSGPTTATCLHPTPAPKEPHHSPAPSLQEVSVLDLWHRRPLCSSHGLPGTITDAPSTPLMGRLWGQGEGRGLHKPAG